MASPPGRPNRPRHVRERSIFTIWNPLENRFYGPAARRGLAPVNPNVNNGPNGPNNGPNGPNGPNNNNFQHPNNGQNMGPNQPWNGPGNVSTNMSCTNGTRNDAFFLCF